MCYRERRYAGGGEDVYILTNGPGLHERHRTGKQRLQGLRAVVRGAGARETVRVKRTPTLCTFEFHPVEPHGLLGHVLDVDFEEHFVAFERVEEGRGGFRGVDLGLDGQGVGDLCHRREILSTHSPPKKGKQRRTENL
jgi:hypothetical protein